MKTWPLQIGVVTVIHTANAIKVQSAMDISGAFILVKLYQV